MPRKKPPPAARKKRLARPSEGRIRHAGPVPLVPALLAQLKPIAVGAGIPLELLLRECLGAARIEADMPPPDDDHVWDRCVPQLMEAFHSVFGQEERGETETPRRKVGAMLAQRVTGRAMGLTLLFRAGMYSEAIPVVRAAYEDWLIAAYLLLQPGEEPCRGFCYEDQQRLLAKTYNGFSKLLTSEIAAQFFAPSDRDKFTKYTAGNASLKPLGGISWVDMAHAVGLKALHEGTYAILSGLAHGSALNAGLSFGPGVTPGAGRPHLFVRDEEREHQFAVWSFWFMLRTVTLGAKEFGHDLEAKSDECLLRFAELPKSMTYGIAVREKWIGRPPSKKQPADPA